MVSLNIPWIFPLALMISQNVLQLMVLWCLGVPLLWCGVLLSAVNRSTLLCWELLPVQEHSLKVTHWLCWLLCWISGSFIHLPPLCPTLTLSLPVNLSTSGILDHALLSMLFMAFVISLCFSSFCLCQPLVFSSFLQRLEIHPASHAFTNHLVAESHKNKRKAEEPCKSKYHFMIFFQQFCTD